MMLLSQTERSGPVGALSQARAAALAGVAFVVLVLVGSFIAGSPPKVNDSAGSIASFFVDHHKTLLIGVILNAAAAPCFVWLFAGLAAAIRRAGQDTLAALTFGAGVGAVAIATVGDAVYATLTQLAWIGESQFVKSGYELSGFLVQKAFWFAAFAALGASLAARRARALPRWYEWATIAAGALFALGGISVKQTGFMGVNGGMALVAFFALLVWVLITSFLLWREQAAAEAPAAVATPA